MTAPVMTLAEALDTLHHRRARINRYVATAEQRLAEGRPIEAGTLARWRRESAAITCVFAYVLQRRPQRSA